MNMELTIANLTNSSNALVNCNAVASEVDTYETLQYDHKMVHNISMVVMPLFYGIIGIFGLVGNSLVITVVAANPKMKSTTNILIINLAVADLLFIIFFIASEINIYVPEYGPFDNVWYKIVEYAVDVIPYENIYTLVLMSLDRYLAVHPIASMSWRKGNYVILAIGVTWVISLALSVPMFINYSKMFFFLMSYVLPLMLICIFYMSMLIKWRDVRVNARRRRGKKSVTRLVFAVVSIFAICWNPGQVIAVIISLDMYPVTTASMTVMRASRIFVYINSCINPILYTFLNDNFRNAFQKIIYCKQQAKLNN